MPCSRYQALALEEANATLRVLSGEELGVGEARVVVDRDVQVLPTELPVAVRAAGLLPEHALARLPEAAELLGIHMQELTRALALVAAGAARSPFGTRQARAPG